MARSLDLLPDRPVLAQTLKPNSLSDVYGTPRQVGYRGAPVQFLSGGYGFEAQHEEIVEGC
jgi:hypothetical protein